MINAMNAGSSGRSRRNAIGAQEMPNKPPYTPTGFTVAMLTNDGPKLGVLIIETAEGDFDFALNLEAVESLAEALEMISLELSGETRQ
jgi:hypothetical protein